MQLRYNFRVYPSPGQQEALARAFGCARVVFNDGLRARQEAREQGLPYVSDGDLSKRLITQAKKTVARAWLGEVSAVVLQQALADLNMAYRNFFASITGARKGRKLAPPRCRSRKDNRQAIRFTANARFKVLDNGRLRLPKIGDLAVRWSRALPAEATSVTIIKDAAGRYFASFVVTIPDQPLPPAGTEVGIDLGLTHFAVLSDGTKVTAPKLLRRAARKLKRLQQDLSRKQRGSQNRKKAVVKVARAHARVADTRRDWQHKLSTAIIRDNQAVYVEDLCVVGLGRPGSPSPCTTRAGPASPPCWSTRPPDTGVLSPGSTGSSPLLGCARAADGSTTRWDSTSGRGPARAGRPTTETSTRPSTCSRRDAPRA
ncbi:transposase [Micromonospora sp. 4G55]|nr:transposase [Micromonospora sp. 4G55]